MALAEEIENRFRTRKTKNSGKKSEKNETEWIGVTIFRHLARDE